MEEKDKLDIHYLRYKPKDYDAEKNIDIIYLHSLGCSSQDIFFSEGLFFGQFKKKKLDNFDKINPIKNTGFLLPDLLGHGGSKIEYEKCDIYTLGKQAKYIYEVIKAEGIKKLVIVGWNLGAPIGEKIIELINKDKTAKINVLGFICE